MNNTIKNMNQIFTHYEHDTIASAVHIWEIAKTRLEDYGYV